ncbi:hypothetical protein [Cryobacterium sp. GrIS_2_6]|uniref:hypothetical protein n=1 Tax=Cryobacterium sp. GrIS_2_6 TaxID=3162785 RepID=UPI002E07943C|nr:hypothetical protein [Cryobacterium psychrotolerans]
MSEISIRPMTKHEFDEWQETIAEEFAADHEYWLRWAPPVVRLSPTVQMRDSYRSAPLPAWLSTT